MAIANTVWVMWAANNGARSGHMGGVYVVVRQGCDENNKLLGVVGWGACNYRNITATTTNYVASLGLICGGKMTHCLGVLLDEPELHRRVPGGMETYITRTPSDTLLAHPWRCPPCAQCPLPEIASGCAEAAPQQDAATVTAGLDGEPSGRPG